MSASTPTRIVVCPARRHTRAPPPIRPRRSAGVCGRLSRRALRVVVAEGRCGVSTRAKSRVNHHPGAPFTLTPCVKHVEAIGRAPSAIGTAIRALASMLIQDGRFVQLPVSYGCAGRQPIGHHSIWPQQVRRDAASRNPILVIYAMGSLGGGAECCTPPTQGPSMQRSQRGPRTYWITFQASRTVAHRAQRTISPGSPGEAKPAHER